MATLPPTFWEERFRGNQTPWERDHLNPAFLSWRDAGTLAPCRILVPGAGRSHEPAAFLEAGFDIIALDLAETAIHHQSARIGAHRVIHADVTTWTPAEPFDAVYDQTCLCALPPHLWLAYEANLRHWLRPAEKLFILLMQTTRPGGPPFDCPIPEMRKLFEAWTWPDTLPNPIPHKLGTLEQPVILVRT